MDENKIKNVFIEDDHGNLKRYEIDMASSAGINLVCMLQGHNYNPLGVCIRCGHRA